MVAPPPDATDALAALIMALLAKGEQPSQAAVARALSKSPGDVAKALRVLELRRVVERFTSQGVRGKGVRLVATKEVR